MNSIKCPECNLTNWATAVECKRCKFLFQTVEAENHSSAYSFEEQNFADTNSASNPRNFHRQANWSPNQNYQYQNNNHYQQPNYRSHQPANLKTGLAIASMVLGILGFVTSIFLVGILLAPIGLILGIVALVKANKKPDVYGGKGFAIAGIVTSAMMVLFVPVVAAIAIPNLLAARRSANEGSAITSIRVLNAAEQTFMAMQDTNKCGDLKTLGAQNLIDSVLANGEKSGYRFSIVKLPAGNCEIHAVPTTASTGTRSFYLSTEDSVLRAADKKGKFADKNDLPFDNRPPYYSNPMPKTAAR